MVGEACLPSNAYYPRTPDYTLCSGVHVCWSEHSDSSFVYGFMILNYGFGTMTATTYLSDKATVFVWEKSYYYKAMCYMIVILLYLSRSLTKLTTDLWTWRRLRSAWLSTQSDRSLQSA